MKFDLPTTRTRAFLLGELKTDRGLASTVSERDLSGPFTFAPDAARARDLVDFEHGHLWPAQANDVEAERYLVDNFRFKWWPIYQNVSAPFDSIPAHRRADAKCFWYNDCYHHLGPPSTLPFKEWSRWTVGFDQVLFLLNDDPRASFSNFGDVLDDHRAAGLSTSVFAIMVSAYDGESWVGSEVAVNRAGNLGRLRAKE